MFCKNCGQQIDDRAFVCPHCGVRTAQVEETKDKSNGIAVVGFVFSFFIAIVGLICSIIGYKKAKEENLDHQGLALAGIIISTVSMALSLIFSIALGSLISAMISSL